jgi:hypothetical protein
MYGSTTQKPRLNDWLKHEYDGGSFYAREVVIIAAGLVLGTGTVLGLNDAGTQYVEYDDAGPDGTVASVILVNPIDTTTGAAKGVVIARGPAIIAELGLAWKTGLLAPAKASAKADLIAKGFKFADELTPGFTPNPPVGSLV